jgi:two-component system nitrate/nitrite response regulator NarL
VPDVLLATDADWILTEVDAALGGSDGELRRVHAGAEVLPVAADWEPDLIVLDLQIGNMGGMACCMGLHHEMLAGRLPHIPVLMLLDRDADVFLAKRSEAEGWIIKPLDAFRLRKAAKALLAGQEFQEHRASADQALP